MQTGIASIAAIRSSHFFQADFLEFFPDFFVDVFDIKERYFTSRTNLLKFAVKQFYMKKKIVIEYQEFPSADKLPKADAELLKEAISATELSYSPFSKFRVGAAVRMANGQILKASNQESEAFPSGLCAERSVLFYAFSKYPGVAVEALAIAAKKGKKLTQLPTRPCGACIQVMLDAQKRGGKPMKVILGSQEKIEVISSVNDLIPFSFDNF